ncbi:MAG: branched-chain-amino-acid transaminase [Nitrospirae bacterium]|jgi:branched-chain amino acid aminotransferase|nr:branched-chain-amino-acid transaminase [Nitrospirota bacterium]
MYVYLNDRIVPAEDAVVSVFDHGFLYGDGIYETMRAYNGIVFMIDEHIERLFRSASLIGLKIPYDSQKLKSAIYETIQANGLENAYIRLTISRGCGSLGLDPEFCQKPSIVIIVKEQKDYPKALYKKGLKVIIAQTRRNLKEAINPRIKSLNFLNNILAKLEAKEKNANEAIMLNVYGKLTEGTISNVFFYKNNMLFTPSIDCGILDGITRGIVIGIAKKQGIEVKEGKFTKSDIYTSQEIFITNTTMEVMPVSELDENKYPVGEISKNLRKLYRQKVKTYIRNYRN